MHVDPILPPIQRTGVVSKLRSFFGNQRMREFFNVVGREVMFVQQNERLE